MKGSTVGGSLLFVRAVLARRRAGKARRREEFFSAEKQTALLAGDAEHLEPGWRGWCPPPRLGRASAARPIFQVVVDVRVSGKGFELVHDDRSAACGAVELLATNKPGRGSAAICGSKRGELRGASSQGPLGRISCRQRTDQAANHPPTQQAAQIRLHPVLATSHGHVMCFSTSVLTRPNRILAHTYIRIWVAVWFPTPAPAAIQRGVILREW